MNEHHRRPAAFRLDDPNVVVTAQPGRAARGTVRIMVEPEPALPVVAEPDPPPRRGFALGHAVLVRARRAGGARHWAGGDAAHREYV